MGSIRDQSCADVWQLLGGFFKKAYDEVDDQIVRLAQRRGEDAQQVCE